ncbi:MAG: response regulator [Nitrospinaceae bacterium]|nr:response regulator [Nitrospinaceae bacterium]MBT7857555.1 response regulator [Nitrospinaceae bacterium]
MSPDSSSRPQNNQDAAEPSTQGIASFDESPHLLLQQIIDVGTRLVGASYGALGVFNTDGDQIIRFLTSGIDEKIREAIGPPPSGKGIIGLLARESRPLRISDLTRNPLSTGIPPHHPTMTSFLGVPLKSQEIVYGNLYFTDKIGEDSFTPEDERIAENFAALAVAAIERRTALDHLHQAEKLEALGRLSAGISHDFNNALGIIHGAAELLDRQLGKENIDPAISEYLDIIMKSAMGAAQTVKRLHDFARKRDDRPASVADLNEAIQAAAEMTRPRWKSEAEASGLQIDLAIRPEARHSLVSGVESELHEILINLINNALDAMPGGGNIVLSTEDTNGGPRVSIKDTGTGMSPETSARAFEPFFSTKGEQGTGMGLSMVFGIIKHYGGSIGIESEAGVGTEISFTLPPSNIVDEKRTETAIPSAGPANILIIEDEPDMARVISDLLSEEGYSPHVIHNGLEATQAFEAGRHDLVISDLAMPGISGSEIARRIKEISPSTPVLLLTGWQAGMPPEEMVQSGIDGIMVKPVRKTELLTRVAQALTARK